MELLDKALSTNSYYEGIEQKRTRVLDIELILKRKGLLKQERESLKRERVQLLTDILQAWRVKKHAEQHTKP